MADTCSLPGRAPTFGGTPPPGWERVITQLPDHWQVITGDRHCSAARCTHSAVVTLKRQAYTRTGTTTRVYGYCGCHLAAYRAWIQDGKVVGWSLCKVEASDV